MNHTFKLFSCISNIFQRCLNMTEDNDDSYSSNLPFHGNERTMNMNNLLLQNIQGSLYFKNDLYKLNTGHFQNDMKPGGFTAF